MVYENQASKDLKKAQIARYAQLRADGVPKREAAKLVGWHIKEALVVAESKECKELIANELENRRLIATKVGLTVEKVYTRTVEGMDAARTTKVKDKDGNETIEQYPDMSLRLKYTELGAKLLDLTKGGGAENSQGEMSYEERLRALGVLGQQVQVNVQINGGEVKVVEDVK